MEATISQSVAILLNPHHSPPACQVGVEDQSRTEEKEMETKRVFVIYAGTSSGGVSPTRKEQPLFTLRQVGMICERLLKEREEKVREEYEETMTSKLAG